MAHLESLVVYDPETRTREALTFGFSREGFKVYATGDSGDAVSMARTKVPQLVVCTVPSGDDATTEALDLIGTLREEGATGDLPVVAVGERNLREQALRAGADEFVAKPAFIRDVLTLSSLAVALRQDGDEAGVAGMLSEYELYFLTRALSTAQRTGVLEMERGGRAGEVHFVKGEVVQARCGKMSGLTAFHHLLLWSEAAIHLRMSSPSGERKIQLSIDHLLADGARFAREFEAVAARVGGTQAVYRHEPRRAAEVRAQIPQEVLKILKAYDGKRPLIDLVEDSPFKPLDTIKITFRLQELGVIEQCGPTREGTPLTSELAVRDWLLGSQEGQETSSVAEAGRRAAEALATREGPRRKKSAAADDPGDRTAKGWKLAESAGDTRTGRKRKVGKRREPTGKHRTAPPSPPGDVDSTVRTPKLDLQPSQPPASTALPDIDATTPFAKMPLELAIAGQAEGGSEPAKPGPVTSRKRKLTPVQALAAARPMGAQRGGASSPTATGGRGASVRSSAKAPASPHPSTPTHGSPTHATPTHASPPQPSPTHASPPSRGRAAGPAGAAPVPPIATVAQQSDIPPPAAQPRAPTPSLNALLAPPQPVATPRLPFAPAPPAQAPFAPPAPATPAHPAAPPHAPTHEQHAHPPHAPAHQHHTHGPAQQHHAHPPAQQHHAQPPAQQHHAQPPAQQHHAQPPTQQHHAHPQAHPSAHDHHGHAPAHQPQAAAEHPTRANGAQRPAKHAPQQKSTPRAAPVREPTVPFNKIEEEFFREGVELANQEPVVDTFDDLEPTGPKRKWWGLGNKFVDPTAKSPKKR
jgi:CheY-like chemotaxis protein